MRLLRLPARRGVLRVPFPVVVIGGAVWVVVIITPIHVRQSVGNITGFHVGRHCDPLLFHRLRYVSTVSYHNNDNDGSALLRTNTAKLRINTV